MIRYFFPLFLIFHFISCFVCGQTVKDNYDRSFDGLTKMLDGRERPDFKKAVFLTENAYFDNKLSWDAYCHMIQYYANFCQALINSQDFDYPEKDKRTISVYAGVFSFMCDTVPVQTSDSTIRYHLPFSYNFDDFAGNADWGVMTVTHLIQTRKGNCHSLPFLYKLIVEELGEKAWLSVAPNHLYIKLQSKLFGWYNTELTCGAFPVDAWLMASGYIHLDAVRNGIYMDTLSLKQSVALCLIDLAQGHIHKTGAQSEFALSCCETALQHYPDYINALLLKVELLTRQYKSMPDKKTEEAKLLLSNIEQQYAHIHNLGYRKMPDKMYIEWLWTLRTQKERFRNNNVNIYSVPIDYTNR